MTKILALIDASTYANSVTALSAWAAGRLGIPVEIVHVLGRRIASNFDLSGSLEADARAELLKQMAELDEQHAKLAQQKGRQSSRPRVPRWNRWAARPPPSCAAET